METVRDIIGKGFKYEERENITSITEIITGTIAAFVGGANWGKIGEPTLLTNYFRPTFGTPIDKYDLSDSSGLALEYHLNYSPLAWFTRVTDGSEQKAKKTITKQAQPAKITGTTVVKDTTHIIQNSGGSQNNKLKINVGGGDNITALDNYDLSFPAITKITIDREIGGVHDPLWALATFTEASTGDDWSYPDSSLSDGPVITLPLELPEDDSKIGWVYKGKIYGMIDGIETIMSTFSWDANLPKGISEVTEYTAEADIVGIYGSHEAGLGAAVASDASGLVDTTVYSFFVDGTEYRFTATAGMTYADVVSAMDSALDVATGLVTLSNAGYTVTFSTNAIRVTADSATTGVDATLTAGATDTNLFITLTDWVAFQNQVSGVTEVDLGGKYFLLNSPSTGYYVWFDKGSDIDPAVVGKTGIKVSISAGDSANDIATATRNAIAIYADFTTGGSGAVIETTCVVGGVVTDGTNGTTGWATAVNITAQGAVATPWVGSIDSDAIVDSLKNVLLDTTAPSYTDASQLITITTSDGANSPATQYELNTVVIDFDATPACSPFTTEDLSSYTLGGGATVGNIAAGTVIQFSIDGNDFTYVVKSETKLSGETVKVPDFTELVTTVSGGASDTYATRYMNALKRYIIQPELGSLTLNAGVVETIDADPYITTSVDYKKMIVQSQQQGSSSIIKMYNMPKAFPTITTASPQFSTSTDTDIEDLLNVMEESFDGIASVYLNVDGKLVFSTNDTGATAEITVLDYGSGTIYNIFGLSVMVTPHYGTNGVADGGTLEAIYTGTEGNTIGLLPEQTEDGNTATIYFRGDIIDRFFGYSYDTTSDVYIGTLINNSDNCKEIVKFYGGDIDINNNIAEFEYNTIMYLVGGTSGTHTGVTPIPDYQYTRALEEYKNIDLYALDMLCVSGNVSQTVADKVEDVCLYRKDCFGIVDPPETVAGYSSGTTQKMINWHNGIGGYGRTSKLDSKYIATYFPWLMIQVDGNATNPKQWHSPSVRVVGAISNSDYNAGHQFAAPAGYFRTPITDVESLAKYVREDDKQRLYADELGNAINPIVFTTNNGFFIDGQKNTDRNFTALSRLGVLRTSLYIKKRVYALSPQFFYQPINKTTISKLNAALTTIAEYLFTSNAIKENYIITTDSSVNTPIVEAQKGLVGVIEWTPVESVEKFKIISIIDETNVQVVIG